MAVSSTITAIWMFLTSIFGANAKIGEGDWEENLVRAYLFWTPLDMISLTAEYLYEDLDRDEESGPGAKNSETHYFPLGINFFHPSGLSASLKTTYIDQEGKYERKDNRGVFIDGSDDFWIVDAAVSYRLPKQYGPITVGVNNLFDESFDYYDSDWKNPRIQPDQFVYAKITLAFP